MEKPFSLEIQKLLCLSNVSGNPERLRETPPTVEVTMQKKRGKKAKGQFIQ